MNSSMSNTEAIGWAIFIFLMVAVSSGCTTTKLPDGSTAIVVDKSSDSNLIQNLTKIRESGHNDAVNATGLATAGNDPDAAKCYPALDAFVQSLSPSSDITTPQVSGVLTIHEKIRLGAIDVAASNGGVSSLKSACAAMVMSDLDFKTRFAALIAEIAAVIPK